MIKSQKIFLKSGLIKSITPKERAIQMTTDEIKSFVAEYVVPEGAFITKEVPIKWAMFLNHVTNSDDYVVTRCIDETWWAFGMYGVSHRNLLSEFSEIVPL